MGILKAASSAVKGLGKIARRKTVKKTATRVTSKTGTRKVRSKTVKGSSAVQKATSFFLDTSTYKAPDVSGLVKSGGIKVSGGFPRHKRIDETNVRALRRATARLTKFHKTMRKVEKALGRLSSKHGYRHPSPSKKK